MKCFPLSLLLSILAFAGHCQFVGLESFASDSVVQRYIRKNGVKAVAETFKDEEGSAYNGRCSFNAMGRVTEYVAGGQKLRLTYQKDNLIRRENYSDTVQALKSWQTWTLDAKGIAVKEGYGVVVDGISKEYLKSDTKVISDTPGKERYEIKYFSVGEIEKTKLIYDTIIGKHTCRMTCEYRANDTLRKSPERSLSFEVKKGLQTFVHEVRLSTTIKPGAIYMINTQLYQYDKAKRLIASYDLDHLRSDGSSGHMYSNYPPGNQMFPPETLNALLAGDTNGVRRLMIKYKYDANSNVVESSDEQYKYRYFYNNKKLITRMEISRYGHSSSPWLERPQFDEAVYTYEYNEKGLFSKFVMTIKTANGKPRIIERTYHYWYR